MGDDTQFVDAEAHIGKWEGISFKEIILEYLRKIGGYSATEMRGGYWNVKETPMNFGSVGSVAISKTYIPDTRETYSNAIEWLYDALYPHFDAEMKEIGKKYEKEVEAAYNEFTIEETVKEEDGSTRVVDRYFKDKDKKISFRNKKRELMRKLFRELSCFLFREKYLEVGSYEE